LGFLVPAQLRQQNRAQRHRLDRGRDCEGNRDRDRDLATDLEHRQPCHAVVRDGAAVSLCFSSRTTGDAAEAGLNTVEAFRRRGYATAVTAAWALAVRRSGRIPLYSTSWDNLASRAVARRLGLILYGADCSIA